MDICTMPFTNHPVADLNQINAWISATECQHFQQWGVGELRSGRQLLSLSCRLLLELE
jgi:hypothetical protein